MIYSQITDIQILSSTQYLSIGTLNNITLLITNDTIQQKTIESEWKQNLISRKQFTLRINGIAINDAGGQILSNALHSRKSNKYKIIFQNSKTITGDFLANTASITQNIKDITHFTVTLISQGNIDLTNYI